MKIVIPNLKCETVNRMYNMYHRTRGAVKKEMQQIAWGEMMRIRKQSFEQCRIIVTAHFRGKTKHDPDNLYVKPFIDALVQARIIKDDNNSIVQSVTLKVVTESKSDFVEIEIL